MVGLRTVLKYRNQAAHDTDTDLTIYDLEAAVSSFCAAYQSAYNLVEGSAAVVADSTSSMERVSSGIQGSRIQGIHGKPAYFFDRFMAHIKVLCFFTSAFLLLAVIRGGSYDFFLALRVLVTFNAGLFIYMYKKKVLLLLLFGGIAFLFNPIFPFYFTREVWKILDLSVMGVFVVMAFKVR